MKGFKPTGFGPNAGFKFPTRFGFTGSTGAYTTVSPYVRRKGFATGGFVREDNPRMKEESIGDQGSALIRRKRSSNNLDQESGGKSPIRPGYKKGGKAHGALGMAFGKKKPMRKADGGPVSADEKKKTDDAIRRNRLESMEEAGMLSDADRAALERMRAMEAQKPPVKKAGGGYIERTAKGPIRHNAYTLGESVKAVPGALKEAARAMVSGVRNAMSNRQRTVEGRNVSVEESAAEAQSGRHDLASNYAKGGKAKRMGYQSGGVGFAPQRVMPQPQARPMMRAPAMPPRALMRSKGGKMKRMGYATGGGVSAGEAKKIAERTVGEHVRYPAPKGHKGLEKVMPKRR